MRAFKRPAFFGRTSALHYLSLVLWLSPLLTGAASGESADRVRSGTGFFVSSAGDVVTGAHVVAGCRAVSVWTRDGHRRAARIVALNAALDIALLRTGRKLGDYAPPPEGPVLGAPVFALGYAIDVENPRRPRTTRGVFVGNDTTASGLPVDVIRAQWRQGDSGGPVLAADGMLVGMVIGRYADHPDLGVALPASEIARFLGEHGVQDLPSRAHAAAAPEKLLLAISVLLQCR